MISINWVQAELAQNPVRLVFASLELAYYFYVHIFQTKPFLTILIPKLLQVPSKCLSHFVLVLWKSLLLEDVSFKRSIPELLFVVVPPHSAYRWHSVDTAVSHPVTDVFMLSGGDERAQMFVFMFIPPSMLLFWHKNRLRWGKGGPYPDTCWVFNNSVLVFNPN